LNFGAGMDDFYKSNEMFEIEKQLDFMKFKAGTVLPFVLDKVLS
jgi:hypothetical protein